VAETRVLELADGRDLAWIEYGVGDGAPVLAFHGSPGTRGHFAYVSDVAARKGVRLIALDRPGYGHSTYHRARSFESWARDVGELADHLGVDSFGVIGHSSGGPNAAVCARFLADRLTGCAIVSGPAPADAGISKHGTSRTNRISQRLMPLAPSLTGLAFEAGLRQAQRAPEKALDWMHRMLPPCDVAVIERPEVRAALREELSRPPASTAGRAAVQDIVLERRPWGFRLAEITMSVQVWHGRLDCNVVLANGVFQANEIPRATLHEVPNQGHWLLYDHFDEILDSMDA
jgi:pimeloyl-ACP methyl ester carboxylesterase